MRLLVCYATLALAARRRARSAAREYPEKLPGLEIFLMATTGTPLDQVSGRMPPTSRQRTDAPIDLGPGALQIAALNDLFQLCPPWLQTGCALNAVNRELGQLAANARRRERKRLLALREEIRRHKFVELYINDTNPRGNHFRILHVKGEYVTLEAICIRYDRTRFGVYTVSLYEWESLFKEWTDEEDWVEEEWESGFESYFQRH